MRTGFDNEKYIALQSENIRKRISQFGGKLYLELGGKLFDDYHASRVLPGFKPDTKISMLSALKDDAEILFSINANHIEKNKIRGDLGIAYSEETLRLMDEFRDLGFLITGIVITHYDGQSHVDSFRKRLSALGIKSWLHYPIKNYPHDIDTIVSDDGFGKNEYVETSRPLVIVTAPGPGSGKMATCLSQLYHEHIRSIDAGYAKFETFPVWNLALKHPVNLAYEAATIDLDDVNMIDPFHMEAYEKIAINYNRDIETFPVLKEMLDTILGESPYKSPTDMGVNMVGFCISDEDAVKKASKKEILRRYYETANKIVRAGINENQLEKMENIMSTAEVTSDLLEERSAAMLKEETTGKPAAAIRLSDGTIITGKTSGLMGCASSCLMNALKHLSGLPDEMLVIEDVAIQPICHLKTDVLGSHNPRLHSDETLIALSISSSTNKDAKAAFDKLGELRGCDAFFSVIPSSVDEKIYKSLGINLIFEPKYEGLNFYHK